MIARLAPAALALLLAACFAGPLVAPLRYDPVAPAPDEPFRSVAPDASPVSSAVPLAFHVDRLDNGLRVAVLARHGLPIVSVELVIERGAADIGAPFDTYGILRGVLESGTADRPASQLSAAYARLGAPHGAFFSDDGCGLGAKVGAADLDAAVALIAETATRPRLDPHAVADVRARWLQDFDASGAQRPAILQRNIEAALFGDAHPYGFARPPRAHSEGVGPEELHALHARLFNPAQATLVVVGDATPEAALASASRWLSGWASTGPALTRPALPQPAPGARVVLVGRRGTPQADAAVVAPGPDAASKDGPALEVLASLLGGFSSRLRGEVRTESGAAYNFHAGLRGARAASAFVIGSALDGTKAVPALQAILAAIAEVRDAGVREPDFQRARTSLVASLRTQVSSIDGLAPFVGAMLARGLSLEAIAAYPERLLAVTPQDVRRVAQAYLAPRALRVVVVGDSDLLRPLATLGLGPVELRDGWAEPR